MKQQTVLNTKENDMNTEIDADASAIKICEMIEQMQVILRGTSMVEGITACANLLIGGMMKAGLTKDAMLAAFSDAIDVEIKDGE
jgi:hypothetical protein